MANVYESKFKGVEIDDGVNIATYATGTGGINVTIKGTTNVTGTGGRHLEIDGSGVKITPVSGTGTSTTDVMSQKAVTDELGKKQDKLTTGSEISIKKLQATTIGAQDNGSLTISVGTINVSGVNADFIDSTAVAVADYSNAPHNLSQLEGDRLSFYYGAADPYDGNVCNLLAPAGNVAGGTTYNIKLPQKSGTVALLSDITGGGSAGVSSIGGKTGAITLSTGLAMSGQQLVNKVKVYTSGNYLCIDTN